MSQVVTMQDALWRLSNCESEKLELLEENAKLREQLANCSRSHPHENMTVACELRTEIARLTNQLAHAEALANANCEQGSRFESAWHEAEAKLKALSEQEPVVVTGHGVHYGDLPWGMKLYADQIPPADVHHIRIEFEEGYPEDVAFGSEQQMLRLKKWLDKFYAQKERLAELERKLAEQQAFILRTGAASANQTGCEELNTILAQAREESTDSESERWTRRLNFIHYEFGVDGSGCDSGDPLDVIESEIRAAIREAQEEGRKERDELAAQAEVMRDALRFYAESKHFTVHQDVWESVSGEPENFLEDENNTATVEDGSVARQALSITPSAALREIQARTLEEVAEDIVDEFDRIKVLLTADAKRKGEPT